MIRKYAVFFLVGWCVYAKGQVQPSPERLDSLKVYTSVPVPVYTASYMKCYQRFRRIVVKVYPYALYASNVLCQLEADARAIEKKRRKRRFHKKVYKGLREDFKYALRDLYTSEGRVLVKLIHRETGMTVYEIAEKYKGKQSAAVFNAIGKLWGQNIKAVYAPRAEDKIVEHVICDIEAGTIPFENEIVRMSKEAYRSGKREHRQLVRKKKKRIQKRDQRRASQEQRALSSSSL